MRKTIHVYRKMHIYQMFNDAIHYTRHPLSQHITGHYVVSQQSTPDVQPTKAVHYNRRNMVYIQRKMVLCGVRCFLLTLHHEQPASNDVMRASAKGGNTATAKPQIPYTHENTQ